MSESTPPSQKDDSDLFGSNTWFVEYLYNEYKDNPAAIPTQWKKYFVEATNNTGDFTSLAPPEIVKSVSPTGKTSPQPGIGDEIKTISGGAAKIIENMEASLSIPVATSQRVIPVKLLEENRKIINTYLIKAKKEKISFTHLIGFAIVQALKKYSSLNNAFTETAGKPKLIKRQSINFGIAIDVPRKDGSRTLMVPNIKHSEDKNFREFFEAYERLVTLSRSGQIDPLEFKETTITLTNPGTLGTVTSIPRLMPGQGTIIAVGAIQYPPEYQAMSAESITNLGISKIMAITSTYDHRIIQGAESGLFLKEIHSLLLGSDGFYELIFEALKIPLRPLAWETDRNPQWQSSGGMNLDEIMKQGRVRQMINMYRVRGHLIASLDPLGTNTIYHEELDPSFYGLTVWDLDRTFVTHDFGGMKTASLRQILAKLHRTYCENIGVEFMHIQSPEEKAWLINKMEPSENKPFFDDNQKIEILKMLSKAEGWEHFIHTKFVGHKRFSLEGSETIIPTLDYILTISADNGVKEAVLGMAHRGRLNVLVNIIGKKHETILSEFEDIIDPDSYAGSGDVKYHLGASGKYKTRFRKEIGVSISSNPSHLEFVNPVVEGITRAKQTMLKDNDRRYVLPILIHGDSAFAGQGIVAETLNLSQLKGYRTGGTIHLIINNQIGFTTTPEEARSSVYATDVAKMIQAPIFHVNGDDPEASLWVGRLAFDYRQQFKKDVVIDLFGYRRHGHNEGDEPGFTQPLLYAKIRKQPSTLEIYRDKLIQENILSKNSAYKLYSDYEDELNKSLDQVTKKQKSFKLTFPETVKSETTNTVTETVTGISENELDNLIIKSTSIPENFHVHPKLQKFLEKRREFAEIAGTKTDWAFAETLAFASLLHAEIPIRLSGQDSVRGTFSQRHLALTDILSGEEYFPINYISKNQAHIEALDSLLSENGVLGFEYGYSTAYPNSLVIWEAQFGDFANAAQVLIDNFIVVSREKWDTPNNLVLLLPHGYEGQGPEHSSARLERFLILCAQDNMEVCYPTTPAQYFHLLRRQALKSFQRPLVVMTPKSILRLSDAKSAKDELTSGKFNKIIDDYSVKDRNEVKRILFTTGKVYYDLAKYRDANSINDTAIIRIEQLYPFDRIVANKIIQQYDNAKDFVWVQEEPKNMGAFNFISQRLMEIIPPGSKLKYSGRAESASPAVGSGKVAAFQQETLVKNGFIV